jgi:type VI secretion system secreted protein Hcp
MSAPKGSPSRRALLLTGASGVGALGALAPMSAAHAELGEPELTAHPADSFLKLTGIPGDSVRDGHEDEIEGLTFAFGAAEAEAAKGSRRLEWERFLFVAFSGIHSAPLFEHLVAGTVIDSAVLSVRRTIEGETSDYARLEIRNATVVSYQVRVHPAEERLIDIVKLHIPSTPTWTADAG